MSNRVTTKFDADGTGFFKVTDKMQHTVMHLSGELKTAIVGALSVETLKSIADATIKFGENIANTSRNLAISTDNAQRFAWACSHAKIEMTSFNKVMNTLDRGMGFAKGGDINKKSLLNKLGLTDDDIKHTTKDNALLKILELTNPRNKNDMIATMMQLGIRQSDVTKVLGAKEFVFDKNNKIVNEDSIDKLEALSQAMTDLGQAILKHIIPIFLKMAKAASDWCYFIVRGMNERTNAEEEAFKASGLQTKPGWWDKMMARSNNKNGNWTSDTSDHEYYIKQLYGEKGLKAYNESLARQKRTNEEHNDDTFANDIEKILKRLDDKMNGKKKNESDAPFERPGIPTKKKTTKEKSVDIGDLPTNEMYKIGGFLGADINYRIERIQIQSRDYLERIAKATEAMSTTTDQTDVGSEYPN